MDILNESQSIIEFLRKNSDILKINGIAKRAEVPSSRIWNMLSNRQINLCIKDVAKLISVLSPLGYIPVDEKNGGINRIIKKVSEITKVPVSKITNCAQDREVIRAREYIVLVNEKITKLSSTLLGKELGGRDHATILSNKKRANGYLEAKDKYFLEFWPEIKRQLQIN